MARFEKTQRVLFLAILAFAVVVSSAPAQMSSSSGAEQTMAESSAMTPALARVTYGRVKVDGLNIALREAGEPARPRLGLLHRFPLSSHQYRNLLASLSVRLHERFADYPCL